MSSIQSEVSRFFTYPAYINLVQSLLSENKTTGDDHSPEMLDYTKLNFSRMEKWNKIGKLIPAWEQLTKVKPQTWWLITEAWCGDASQIVPFIAKIAARFSEIELKLILRDENSAIINRYLTNGAQAIPKLIAVEYNNQSSETECFTWGPRPQNAQNIVLAWKKNPTSKSREQLYEEIHAWYAHDKGTNIQQELFLKLSSLQ